MDTPIYSLIATFLRTLIETYNTLLIQAFSKNNQDTITTLDPAFQNVIGTVQDVSPGDADVVRRVYCAG